MLYYDIGAYAGLKTAEYLFLSPDMRVIAVEPNPVQADTLRAKFSNDNVVVVQKAVSDHIGTATLHVPSCGLSTLSTLVPETHFTGRFASVTTDKKYEVETTTLDALIAEYGLPSFIKIDCEDMECTVLRGLSHKVRLSFEYRCDAMANFICCLRRLSQLGKYRCCITGGDTWASSYGSPRETLHCVRETMVKNPGLWGDCYVEWLGDKD